MYAILWRACKGSFSGVALHLRARRRVISLWAYLFSMSCQEKLMKLSTKEKGLLHQNQTLITNSTLKNPLPYLLSNLVFHYLNYHFTPFVILKFKRHPSSMGYHPSSSIIIQSSRKPVTFQNSSVISVGTMTSIIGWLPPKTTNTPN